MSHTILTAALIALLAATTGCATSRQPRQSPPAAAREARRPEQARIPAQAAALPRMLGVVVLTGSTGVLCTSGPGPRPGQRITVVLPDAGETRPALALAGEAALEGKRSCHMDDAGRPTLTKLSFEGRQETTPALGIAVLRPDKELRLDTELKVDLDADGMKESFKTCTSSEGVHLTVWTGSPDNGIRRWHAYYHVSYDTEPTCTAGET
jgi:hypothetical protein